MSRLRTILLLVVALGLLFVAGPQVKTEGSLAKLDEVQVGEDVDAWLLEGERRFDDIEVGKAKRIVWNGEPGSQTEFSIVYLHGFSASSFETKPFPDSVAAALGANLFYTRIAGHGRTGEALGKSMAEEWLQDTVEGIRVAEAIGEKVIIIGTSTGATLAAWAAVQDELRSSVVAQIWISPNFAPADERSKMLLWPWGRTLLKIIQGDTYSWEPQNELHAAIGNQAYGSDVLLQVMGLVEMVRNLNFDQVETPVFMVYSPADTVIDQRVSEDVWETLGSAKKDSMVVLRALDQNNHVIVGEALGPDNIRPILERVLEFVRESEGG